MRYFVYAVLLTALVGCKDNPVHKTSAKQKTWHPFSLNKNSIVDAKFPLKLSGINLLDTTHTTELTRDIKEKIEKIIYDNYYETTRGDSSQKYYTVKETYIKTIRIRDTVHTIYLVLFNHMNYLNSEVLFFDNKTNKLIGSPIDFNLFALYDEENGKLQPSNLKTLFKLTSPEIELINDKNGISEYKFNRLYHNGTANAIEITILKVSNNKIDTVFFKQKWIGPGSDNP